MRRRWHLRFLNAASREDFRVLRNLKSLTEILYRFIKVGFHFLSGFKVNIADTRVFHLACGTGKYQRALNLRTGKLYIDLCPGLKVNSTLAMSEHDSARPALHPKQSALFIVLSFAVIIQILRKAFLRIIASTENKITEQMSRFY